MPVLAFGTSPFHFKGADGAGFVNSVVAPGAGVAVSAMSITTGGDDKAWLEFAAQSEIWATCYTGRNTTAAGNFMIFRSGTTNVLRVTVPTSTTIRVDYWDGAAWQELIAAQTLWSNTPVKRIDIHLKLDDTTGAFELKVDGAAPLLSFAGDTILNGISTIDRLYLGSYGGGGVGYFINLMVADEDASEWIAIDLATAANGNYTAWTGDEAAIDDRGNNYAATEADLIYSQAADERESFTGSAIAASYDTGWDVIAVGVLAQARRTGAGGNLALFCRSGSTDADAAAETLAATWSGYQKFFATDPATAAAWATVNTAEAAQIGVKSTA